MLKKNLFFIAAFIIFSGLKAQENNSLVYLQDKEKELAALFDSLYNLEDTAERDSLNRSVILSFTKELSQEEGFYYRWPELGRMGKVYSEDDRVKLYTWYLQKGDGDYAYFGLLSYRMPGGTKKKKADIVTVLLEDVSDGIKDPENLALTPESWYGCVYYSMKTFSHRRNSWYALIGYDFNDQFSDKKLIEILQIDPKGEVVFEGKFKYKDKEIKRMIFEYSSEVAMFLNYDPRLRRIVFDHLRPFDPVLAGNFRFYAPDGSYDALRFEKGSFILEEDVDARNE